MTKAENPGQTAEPSGSRQPASNKIRLFIGAQISLTSVRALADAAKVMRRAAEAGGLRVKWVDPANYHVTLKFLGWTKREAIEAIRDAVAPVLVHEPAFTISAVGSGGFPKIEKARVLWAGIRDTEERLARIAKGLDRALAPLGYPQEKRAFHAHVTLGRLREVADAQSMLDTASEQEFSVTRVESVVLFESLMKSSGSEYKIRHHWTLDGGETSTGRQSRAVEQDTQSEH